MATNSLQSLHHRHYTPPLGRRHSTDYPPPQSLHLKPPNTPTSPTLSTTSSGVKTFSVSPTTSTSAATATTSQFDLLRRHLSANDFRQADEETRRLLIALAGDSAQKRGYVFFSEVQFIADSHLKTIDELWRNHSNNKFGYSIQKKIWEKSNRDFTRFFIKVGWMKRLDTEVEQYNYKAFPDEFIWELTEGTPEGHLPLTNALRGTQLLSCILSHPAFEDEDEDEEEEGNIVEEEERSVKKGGFKADYSF